MSWRDDFVQGVSAPAEPEPPVEAPAALACLISGCREPAADVAYCCAHRVQADDGSLWLRCVFCGSPVAPHDPIACAAHRQQLEEAP